MNMKDERTILRYIILTLISGMGPVGQNLLLSVCGGIDACFELTDEELIAENEADSRRRTADRISGLSKTSWTAVANKQLRLFLNQRVRPELQRAAQEILDTSIHLGVSPITKEDEEYPNRFAGIADMPVLLYVKGNLRINDYSRSLGIVGARRCSREGREQAILLGRQAADSHQAVISGMARGIDAYGQTAALKEGGYTIAVTGSGPDICYPQEHKALYEAIAENGCIVSEYAPGTKPAKYMFPMRNRLIAALSDVLYVIDAGRNSGTRSTVAYCRKYGRIVEALIGRGI